MSKLPINPPLHSGFAIAIAWPGTYCKQPGSWYDKPMKWVGINNSYYYKAGHAALVLVDKKTNICHYFDFGRYHAPFKHGRVRSSVTDHDLSVHTKAVIDQKGNMILNFNEIMHELLNKPACHGDGPLYASYCPVSFDRAMAQARAIQGRGPVLYGPFVIGGSNCSRFVNTVIRAGRPKRTTAVQLRFVQPVTPSPIGNVNALPNKMVFMPDNEDACQPTTPHLVKSNLKHTLPQPVQPDNISPNAQWLAGEGAGSWFTIKETDRIYQITRFNLRGEIECQGRFLKTGINQFALEKPFKFVHLSHCEAVSIEQEGSTYLFKRIYDEHDKKLTITRISAVSEKPALSVKMPA